MCELCNYIPKTKLYYETKEFRIFDCDFCNIPIVALKSHTMEIDTKTLSKILGKIKLFFGEKCRLRLNQRKIQDHFHMHILCNK